MKKLRQSSTVERGATHLPGCRQGKAHGARADDQRQPGDVPLPWHHRLHYRPDKDRGDATHTFAGQMRYFGLSQNGTGRALKNSLVVKNLEDRRLTFTLKGVVFGKNVTKTDGRQAASHRRPGP